ncbi:MAG: GNAT family N-acetyltransferase [Roseburia sp.]
MQIIKAQLENFDIVKRITHKTISEIYPHYYAKGAVDFFLAHHNDENISNDIRLGEVYLLSDDENGIGTVTIKKNEICRLFVLPEYQHRGYGKTILDFAEKIIAEEYQEIYLASSLAAKHIYLKRGYVAVETHTIVAENGDVLCYDWMKKNSNYKNESINYDGRKFVPQINSENGEVDEQTIFHYHQRNHILWAEYAGGEIEQGFLIGTVDDKGNLTFTYQHLNESMQIRFGKCKSKPIYLDDGKLELHEEWQWLNGDESSGKSVIIEI